MSDAEREAAELLPCNPDCLPDKYNPHGKRWGRQHSAGCPYVYRAAVAEALNKRDENYAELLEQKKASIGLNGQLRLEIQERDAELATLSKLRAAIEGYYLALDKREHGGVARDHAFTEIQTALNMAWNPGLAARIAAEKKAGG